MGSGQCINGNTMTTLKHTGGKILLFHSIVKSFYVLNMINQTKPGHIYI